MGEVSGTSRWLEPNLRGLEPIKKGVGEKGTGERGEKWGSTLVLKRPTIKKKEQRQNPPGGYREKKKKKEG